ncbi:hypothetical protein INT45_011256, partial [Circinella minor]
GLIYAVMIMNKDMNTYDDLDGLPEITWVDPKVIHIASLVTNAFENGNKVFGYAACQDIGDMRGFTVRIYLFICEISQLNSCDIIQRASTAGLESFCESWKKEACSDDQLFAIFQKQWTLNSYLFPSARFAAGVGITSLLSQLIFYDTIIQHGYQFVEPKINMMRILNLTGTRGENESEKSYFTRFLTIRRQSQYCYPDNVWPLSATRIMDFQNLVNNFDTNRGLQAAISLPHFGQVITGDERDGKDVSRCL